MAEVCLRPWRASDAADVAEMAADEHVRRWSTLGADVDAWLAGEVAQARGPSRAICVAGEDRALGRVAFRPPGLVLDIEPSNVASIRLAGRIGAERREPPRIQTDWTGIRRMLVVCVLTLPWRRCAA